MYDHRKIRVAALADSTTPGQLKDVFVRTTTKGASFPATLIEKEGLFETQLEGVTCPRFK